MTSAAIVGILARILSVGTHAKVHFNKYKYQRKYRKHDITKGEKDIPLNELFYLMLNDQTVGLWDKIAACIEYQYPMTKHLKYPMKESTNKQKELLRYAVKFASYAYFMPLIGPPGGITIKCKDKRMPFFGSRATKYAHPGYFIGVDHENKRIVLSIRGTETIGDILTDLNGKPERKAFGIIEGTGPYYSVHPGIFKAAQHLQKEEKVSAKIKTLLGENEGYKVIVTGHSLGAGVCSMLGLIWKSQKIFADDQFKCFSFASPLIIDEAGVKASIYGNNMISVAVTSDIVTRVSVKGMHQMKERIKVIKNTPKYKEICANICISTYSMSGWLDDPERKLMEQLKAVKGPEDYTDLYPAGKLIWSVPDCVVVEPVETEKFKRLLMRINLETSSNSSFRMIQFIQDLVRDFTVSDRNERLAELIGSVIPNDRSVFTQMVFNGFESLDAHFPGRYTNGFDVDIVDVFKMSKYYGWIEDKRRKFKLKIPKYVINVLVMLVVLVLFGISTAFGIMMDFMEFLGGVYKEFKRMLNDVVNDYKQYDNKKRE